MASQIKASQVLEPGDKLSCGVGIATVEKTIPGFVIVHRCKMQFEVCDDAIDVSNMSFDYQCAQLIPRKIHQQNRPSMVKGI